MRLSHCCNARALVEIHAAPQHDRFQGGQTNGCRTLKTRRIGETAMTDQQSLLAFLAESAHELSSRASRAPAGIAAALQAEADELMAIRSSIIARSAQMELPLE